MKLSALVVYVVVLTYGLGGVTYASSSYFPPERINCKLTEKDTMQCKAFDRRYLAVDFTNAAFQKGKHKTFNFYSAVAYLTPDNLAATVFYTYRTYLHETTRLKTIVTSIRPDLKRGNWEQRTADIYVCTAGYMSCPITNLPTV